MKKRRAEPSGTPELSEQAAKLTLACDAGARLQPGPLRSAPVRSSMSDPLQTEKLQLHTPPLKLDLGTHVASDIPDWAARSGCFRPS